MKQDTEQLRQLAYDYLKDGRLEYERGNTDDSITLTEKAKNTFETIGDKEGCASSLNMLAVFFWEQPATVVWRSTSFFNVLRSRKNMAIRSMR